MEVFLSLHLSLEGLRRIGWPHTASHDAKFPSRSRWNRRPDSFSRASATTAAPSSG